MKQQKSVGIFPSFDSIECIRIHIRKETFFRKI